MPPSAGLSAAAPSALNSSAKPSAPSSATVHWSSGTFTVARRRSSSSASHVAPSATGIAPCATAATGSRPANSSASALPSGAPSGAWEIPSRASP
jgi:hypothetical protein